MSAGSEWRTRPTRASAELKGETMSTSLAPSIWHWQIETLNFSFDAYGSTRVQCTLAMSAAWHQHSAECDATLTFDEVARDSAPKKIVLGSAFRDGHLLAQVDAPPQEERAPVMNGRGGRR
jgi:hypothetical protein